MQLARPAHDERHNLRPVILAACFLWGIFCGFLIHALRQPPGAPLVPTSETPPAKSGEGAAGTTTETATAKTEPAGKKRVDPDKTYANLKTEPAPGKTPAATKSVFEATPEPSPLTINPRCGLTGATARQPLAPETRIGPTPATHPRPKDPASLAPPELE